MSYLPISKRITDYLSSQEEISSEQKEIITYVIEVILINVLNFLSLLLLGLLFNVLPGIITCLIVVRLLRHNAGGAHSNSPWRCALITAIVFVSISTAASYLSNTKQIYIDGMAIIAISIGIFLIARLAPVDSPAAPIISTNRRKRLKYYSLIVIGIISVTMILLRQCVWVYCQEVQITIIFSILWVSFNLTHFAHQIMLYIDNINLKKGGE